MMENKFQMFMIGELTFFLRYLSEANKARYLHPSSQVHEELDEEVQHGRAQAPIDSDEHSHNTGFR
jgi:hypothetical protein